MHRAKGRVDDFSIACDALDLLQTSKRGINLPWKPDVILIRKEQIVPARSVNRPFKIADIACPAIIDKDTNSRIIERADPCHGVISRGVVGYDQFIAWRKLRQNTFDLFLNVRGTFAARQNDTDLRSSSFGVKRCCCHITVHSACRLKNLSGSSPITVH